MAIGAKIQVTGYITQDKFLLGRKLSEIERLLGFQPGRLSQGATFIKLTELPKAGQFNLAGYSMTAEHRHATPRGLDVVKLKSLAFAQWTLSGRDRLIKVVPAIAHDRLMDPDEQYPPGEGVPQWKLLDPMSGVIVAQPKTSSEKYIPSN